MVVPVVRQAHQPVPVARMFPVPVVRQAHQTIPVARLFPVPELVEGPFAILNEMKNLLWLN